MQGKWEPAEFFGAEAAPLPLSRQQAPATLGLELSGWRRTYALEGAGLILIALACFWSVAAAATVWPMSVAIPLIVACAVALASAVRSGSPNLALSVLLGLIPLVAGLYLLGARDTTAHPGTIFAAYFTASGVTTILLAGAHRRQLYSQWEWLTVSGVTSVILALLIFSGLPGPFTWMLGVLLGVHFMFQGSARLALALNADQAQLRGRSAIR